MIEKESSTFWWYAELALRSIENYQAVVVFALFCSKQDGGKMTHGGGISWLTLWLDYMTHDFPPFFRLWKTITKSLHVGKKIKISEAMFCSQENAEQVCQNAKIINLLNLLAYYFQDYSTVDSISYVRNFEQLPTQARLR